MAVDAGLGSAKAQPLRTSESRSALPVVRFADRPRFEVIRDERSGHASRCPEPWRTERPADPTPNLVRIEIVALWRSGRAGLLVAHSRWHAARQPSIRRRLATDRKTEINCCARSRRRSRTARPAQMTCGISAGVGLESAGPVLAAVDGAGAVSLYGKGTLREAARASHTPAGGRRVLIDPRPNPATRGYQGPRQGPEESAIRRVVADGRCFTPSASHNGGRWIRSVMEGSTSASWCRRTTAARTSTTA